MSDGGSGPEPVEGAAPAERASAESGASPRGAPASPVPLEPLAPRPKATGASPMRRSGVAELRRAIIVGLAVAMAIVGMALFLRADPPATTQAPGGPVVIGGGPAPSLPSEAAWTVAEASAPPRSDPRPPAPRRGSVATAGAGYRGGDPSPVPVAADRPRID